MSKSLGNFIDMATINAYRGAFGDDALRWYLLTQGPLGATDADFAHDRFVEVYNSDLANGIGNAASRVSNMIAKYFDGTCPEPADAANFEGEDWAARARELAERCATAMERVDLTASLRAGIELSATVDQFIHRTEPFKRAKDPARLGEVATILYQCAEALRIAAVMLTPAMPTSMGVLLERFGQAPAVTADSFASACAWGGLEPGTPIVKGEALFPRADADAPAPVPVPGEGADA
jgi:methionyl-tRNA synthetase